MVDLIVIAIILACIGGAVTYMVKEKKKGTRCIGCPAAGSCARSGQNGACCSGCQPDITVK